MKYHTILVAAFCAVTVMACGDHRSPVGPVDDYLYSTISISAKEVMPGEVIELSVISSEVDVTYEWSHVTFGSEAKFVIESPTSARTRATAPLKTNPPVEQQTFGFRCYLKRPGDERRFGSLKVPVKVINMPEPASFIPLTDIPREADSGQVVSIKLSGIKGNPAPDVYIFDYPGNNAQAYQSGIKGEVTLELTMPVLQPGDPADGYYWYIYVANEHGDAAEFFGIFVNPPP